MAFKHAYLAVKLGLFLEVKKSIFKLIPLLRSQVCWCFGMKILKFRGLKYAKA